MSTRTDPGVAVVKKHDALKMARTPRAKRRSRTASHVDDTTRHDGVRRAAQARVHQAKQYVLVEEKRAKKTRLWSDDRTKYSAQRRANQADTDGTDMGNEQMSIRVSFLSCVRRAVLNAEKLVKKASNVTGCDELRVGPPCFVIV